eukprot:9498514-Pyramimonas_sp.AAC.1
MAVESSRERVDRVARERERLHIVGRKKCMYKNNNAPELRPEQFIIDKMPLAGFLDPDLAKDTHFSQRNENNLARWKELYANDPVGTIAIVDLNQTPSVRGKADLNTSPELTTTNEHLFVFQVGTDKYGRWLANEERFMLQGFDPAVTKNIPPYKAVQATGSTPSMPAMGISLARAIMDRKV